MSSYRNSYIYCFWMEIREQDSDESKREDKQKIGAAGIHPEKYVCYCCICKQNKPRSHSVTNSNIII